MNAATRQRGVALVLMVFGVLIMVAAALGVWSVGGASGHYVRRQMTADAGSLSGARVLAERLRHIGRLQDSGFEKIDLRDINYILYLVYKALAQVVPPYLRPIFEALSLLHYYLARFFEEWARLLSEAALLIAADTPFILTDEVGSVTDANGATGESLGGLPIIPTLPNEWFGLERQSSLFSSDFWWVKLQPPFPLYRLKLSVDQPGMTGESLEAVSVSWVESPRGWPSGPLTWDDWFGRLQVEVVGGLR